MPILILLCCRVDWFESFGQQSCPWFTTSRFGKFQRNQIVTVAPQAQCAEGIPTRSAIKFKPPFAVVLILSANITIDLILLNPMQVKIKNRAYLHGF